MASRGVSGGSSHDSTGLKMEIVQLDSAVESPPEVMRWS